MNRQLMNFSKMRLDRSLTTAIFHPLYRAGFPPRGQRLPILMYHSISDDPETGVPAYYKTNTSPAVFARQMEQLANEGYSTIDLTQATRLLARNQLSEEKQVVITFDDGYRNFYTGALPALCAHGFSATIFLPTAFIQTAPRLFKETSCLTWDEVRDLRKAGVQFGSHTVNHPKLVDLSPVEIERELRDSKSELEQQLGEAVTTFAYPYAFPQGNIQFAQFFKKLLIDTGYDSCVTTELGRVKLGDDPYRLKRLPANSLDDPTLFQAKIEGGYDWLAGPQALIKKLKSQKSAAKNAVSPLSAPSVSLPK